MRAHQAEAMKYQTEYPPETMAHLAAFKPLMRLSVNESAIRVKAMLIPPVATEIASPTKSWKPASVYGTV